MTNDLNNIPTNNNADKEKLLQQLNDDLFGEEDALDQQFEEDASIGLQQIQQEKVPLIVDKLNADLSRHLSKKKKRRGIFKDPSNFNITIITILLLLIISYIILKKLLG
jgi:hypothetical protein